MKLPLRQGLILFCSLLLLGAIALGTGMAASGFEITVEDAVDTPSKSIEFEGDEYEVDSIAVYEASEVMPVKVTLPDADRDNFDLLLYNSDRNKERSQRVHDPSSSESVLFETDGAPPGTYSLNLEVEGSLEIVHPVVIPGYDLSIDAPASASPGDTVDIEVTVMPTELEDDPAAVEVILWTDDHTERIDAKEDGGNTYTATVSLDEFDTTEYNVYATAQGEETFQGEQEILGLVEGAGVTVTDEDGSSGGGAVGPGGVTPVEEQQPVDETTVDDNTTDSVNGTDEESVTEGDNATTEISEGNETDSPLPDNSTDPNGQESENNQSEDIITPNPDNESAPVEEQPFNLGIVVVALGVFLLMRSLPPDQ